MDVKERVAKVIAERLTVPIAEVTEEKNIVDDLGADSLGVVDLISGLEDEFKIQISDEDAEGIKTVKDAIVYMEGHVNG